MERVVLVAGGAGFIGTNLCERLLSDDCRVICLDNLLTGRHRNIGDTVEGLIVLMASLDGRGETFNLGNPREEAVLACTQTIKTLVGSSSPIIYTEQAVGDDPQRRRPDISKAVQRLGWMPHVSLEDGLAATVAYFQHELVEAPVAIATQGRRR